MFNEIFSNLKDKYSSIFKNNVFIDMNKSVNVYDFISFASDEKEAGKLINSYLGVNKAQTPQEQIAVREQVDLFFKDANPAATRQYFDKDLQKVKEYTF